MDHWLDVDFVINSFLQHCTDTAASARRGSKAIDAALEVAEKNIKFVTNTMSILTVLRKYARYMDELRSSASAANDDVAHLRAVRNRIESIRYVTAKQLHIAVVVSLLLVGTCLTLEYTLSQQKSDKFSTCVRMIDTSVGLRMNLHKSLIEVRGLDLDLRSSNNSRIQSRVTKIMNYCSDFESRFTDAYIKADTLASIAEFWANYRVPVRLYIKGENSTRFDSGSYNLQQMPLWDAGMSLLNHMRDLGTAVAADPDNPRWVTGDGLAADENFRFIIDNGPGSFADALMKSYNPFSGGIRDAANSVSLISLGTTLP
eukprot:m51a1_g12712 hypothetical protein (315) ;mRNA; f:904-2609